MDHTLTQQGAPRPLSDLLEDGRAWPVEESLRLAQRLGFQVRALHEGGRTHRAIGVDAVIVDDHLRPQLAAGPPKRRFGGEDSDPEFCPPELAEGDGLDLPESIEAAAKLLTEHGHELDPRRIDIYQLGTLLCRLLSGEPIQAYMYRPKVKAAVPALARSLLERSLGYDAQNRFQTCDQLLDALSEALRDSGAEPADSFARATPPGGSAVGAIGDTPPQGHPAPSPRGDEVQPSESLPFQRLGRYRILARIGSGGMGDVYRGYDESLDRTVAIKVLPAELAKHEDFVQRFRAEATAAAKLAHPNVVPIFSIDEDAGHHFFAMQYVEGESLAARLERRKRLPLEEAIRLIEQSLAGLEAAHNAGLIHRDIKPANILLDAVTGRALLVDFGLVRRMGQSERLTATGVIMGTVDYIAPEQARGHAVDGRADLYALGVLFYQVLSGRLPFEADTPTAMIFQHAYEDPFPLEEAAPEVPPPVLAIVARMMAKEPQDRYQSAREVLADLEAFREGRPATAEMARAAGPGTLALDREPALPERLAELAGEGVWRRARDWAATMFRRHAPEAILELQSTTQQVDGAIGHYGRRCRRLEGLLSEAKSIAADLSGQLAATRQAAGQLARQVESAPEEDVTDEVLAKKRAIDEDLAALEARHAEQQGQVEEIELQLGKARATLARLQSQRDVLQARLKMAQAGVRRAPSKPKPALLVAVAGVAIVVVAGLVILTARLLRPGKPGVNLGVGLPSSGPAQGVPGQRPAGQLPVSTGSLGERVITFQAQPACLAFTPASTPTFGFGFAVGNQDGTVNLLNIFPNGDVRTSGQLNAHLEKVNGIAFSPDAKWFATADKDGTTRIWKTWAESTRRELRRLAGDQSPVTAVCFSPDGSRVLSASQDRTLRVWEVLTESEIKRSRIESVRSSVQTMDWSRDGNRVLLGASVEGAQSMSLWNLLEDREERVFDTNKQRTAAVAFSRSEDQAYSLHGRSIYVHDLESGSVVKKLGANLHVAAFSPSSRRAWSADYNNHSLTLWDLRSGAEIQTFTGHTRTVEQVAISRDGSKALSASLDGTIRVWDLPPPPPPENQLQVLDCGGPGACVAFAPDGFTVLTGGLADVSLWTVQDGRKAADLSVGAHVACAAFSVDGRSILYGTGQTGSKEGLVALRDAANPSQRDLRQMRGHQGPVTRVALSADGRHAVSGSTDGTVRVWDVSSGQEIDKLDVGIQVNSVALSKIGGEILIGANDKVLRLWRWGTTKKVDQLEGHTFVVLDVAFSADGKRAASAGGDRTVCVWDPASGKRLAKLEGHSGRVNAVALSEHGMTVLSGGDDGTVRLWDVGKAQEIQRYEGHSGPVRSVAMSPDGTRAISAGDDSTARVWKLPIVVQ